MELFMVDIPQLKAHTTIWANDAIEATRIAVAGALGMPTADVKVSGTGSITSEHTFTYLDELVFTFKPSRAAKKPRNQVELARFCGHPELPLGI